MERVSEMTFFGNDPSCNTTFSQLLVKDHKSLLYGFLSTFLLSFTIFCHLVRWEAFRSTYPLSFFISSFYPYFFTFYYNQQDKTKLFSHHILEVSSA